MRILFFTVFSMMMPAICFAHSGTVMRTVANYIPFIAPILMGCLAIMKNVFIGMIGKHDTDKDKK